MAKPIELIFKEIDGLNILMDVYIPEAASKESPVPVLLWWHGGGLLQVAVDPISTVLLVTDMGGWVLREQEKVRLPPRLSIQVRHLRVSSNCPAVSPHMLAAPEKHNLCLISPDYRLAPQTLMPGILSDCKAALDFLQTSVFAEKTGHRIDTSRIVLSGSSAGGWLSLLAGTGVGFEACGLQTPCPVKGIAALYSITDLLDPFWKVVKRPVSYMDRVIGHDEVQPFIDPADTKRCFSALDDKRGIFYNYMVQEGILSSLLLDGTGIPEQSFSIAQALKSGKYSPPPVYLVTGNNDRRVPHTQSLDVVSAITHISGRVEYDELDGLDHLFDREVGYEMENMYGFVKEVLGI